MQRLEVSVAVRPIYGSLGVKRLKPNNFKSMEMFTEWKRGDCQKKLWKWSAPGRRKRGTLELTWAEGVRGLMGEKGLREEYWNDRDKWKKTIYCQMGAGKCGNIVQYNLLNK